MKRKLIYAGAGICAFAILFILSGRIGASISSDEIQKIPETMTAVKERNDIEIFKIKTGHAATLEGFILAGGSFIKPVKAVHMTVLVKHPRGSFLIDTGLGKNIDEQFRSMPFWAKNLFHYTYESSAADFLFSRNISIDSILLTHMHFDHASGIKDFPDAGIWTTEDEFDFAFSDRAIPPGFIRSQYNGKINWKFYNFSSGPYEIFSESQDLFNDGSVVIVRLKGHTKGSVGIFINISDKKRYFFTGDLTWTVAGLKNPSHKYAVTSMIIDYEKESLGKEILRISEFLKKHPEIIPIPTHDAEAFSSLEFFPENTGSSQN